MNRHISSASLNLESMLSCDAGILSMSEEKSSGLQSDEESIGDGDLSDPGVESIVMTNESGKKPPLYQIPVPIKKVPVERPQTPRMCL